MVEWLIAAAVFVLLMLAMVQVLTHAKPRLRKGGGGFIIALGMVFASVFDPAKAAAVEQLDRHKKTEGSEEGASGAGPE
jgi:hypothetical protein